ncbi:MAG: RcpC/CpaB family pilus assembly protein [Acidimicrobiia bacterium]
MRRSVGIVVAVALAAVGTFILVSYVRSAERRALAGEETVEVLIVDEPIARGTAAEEIAGKLRTERVPVKVQAIGSVATVTELEGTVAAVDLVPGEQVVSSRFLTPEVFRTQQRVDPPPGYLQVTVSLEPQRAVGGQLTPGDTVAVLASFDPIDLNGLEPGQEPPTEDKPDLTSTGSRTPRTTHVILHKVLVTNVQVEQLPRSTDEAAGSIEGPDLAPTGNLLITLAVKAPAVEQVVFTAEHGFLWLAIEPGNASEAGTTIQTRETIYQ